MTLVRILGTVVFFVIGVYFVAMGIARSSLPTLDGEKTLSGLKDTVTITRNDHGVPRISASTDADLNFALGYVHAQDRLFQMEMNRRIGRGELAEIIGAAGVTIDQYFRTLGFRRLAENTYETMPEEGRTLMDAYVAGVNAFINGHRGAWSPGFEVLDFKPRPWTAIDSLVWQKIMWLDLSGNARFEAIRAELLTKLTPDQVTALYPLHPGDSEPPLPSLQEIFGDVPLKAGLFAATAKQMGGEPVTGYGSNNWVVSGALTKSGMPLLANDPHLGLSTPSIWYLVHLHNENTGSNAVGVGFPGLPGIVLGRNDRIAWGFTNTAPDIQDLFVEKLVGNDSYLTPDGPKKLNKLTERINVRFGDPIDLEVVYTRHGPVISYAYPGIKDILKDDYVVALQWTAFKAGDTGSYAIFKLMEAQNFDEFVKAGQYYLGPQQNMIYADVDGNIGYHAPAVVPVRHENNKAMGRLPVPGWDATYDWQGFIPITEVPRRFNPASGMIATANERVVDDSYPHFITRDWSLPYRGNRIRNQLETGAPHDKDSFATLHGDIVSDMARELKPLLIEAATNGISARARPYLEKLADWNGTMDKELVEPLLFQSWVSAFQEALLQDELGADLYARTRSLKPRIVKSALFHSLGKTADTEEYFALPPLEKTVSMSWCDDVTTTGDETCQGLAAFSLDQALDTLEKRYGGSPDSWTWGRAHVLVQSNRPFSQIPVLGSIFHLTTPQDGGRYTVNVAGNSANPSRPHLSSFGPSYRGIFDFSDLDQSRFVQPTGQSEHPMSPYFKDMFEMWKDVTYVTLPTDPSKAGESKHRLVLKPSTR